MPCQTRSAMIQSSWRSCDPPRKTRQPNLVVRPTQLDTKAARLSLKGTRKGEGRYLLERAAEHWKHPTPGQLSVPHLVQLPVSHLDHLHLKSRRKNCSRPSSPPHPPNPPPVAAAEALGLRYVVLWFRDLLYLLPDSLRLTLGV